MKASLKVEKDDNGVWAVYFDGVMVQTVDSRQKGRDLISNLKEKIGDNEMTMDSVAAAVDDLNIEQEAEEIIDGGEADAANDFSTEEQPTDLVVEEPVAPEEEAAAPVAEEAPKVKKERKKKISDKTPDNSPRKAQQATAANVRAQMIEIYKETGGFPSIGYTKKVLNYNVSSRSIVLQRDAAKAELVKMGLVQPGTIIPTTKQLEVTSSTPAPTVAE